MSAKSKKSAAKKKNEKLKKKQAAKIARKAVIEKKAAADPSFKIKEDKKELAAQKKAEKREKKLLKKRELAKKKKQDLNPDKKPSQKKTPPDGKKAKKKDKTFGKKSEAQAAPPKQDAPKEKKHKDTKQPAAREPGALLEAGLPVAPAEAPEPVAEQADTVYQWVTVHEALPDKEETTLIEEAAQREEIIEPERLAVPEFLRNDEESSLIEESAQEEEPVEPGQADVSAPLPDEEETTVIDESVEAEETAETGQADIPQTLLGEEMTALGIEPVEKDETLQPRQEDVLEPLPPLEEEEADVTPPVTQQMTEDEIFMPRQADILEPLPELNDEGVPFHTQKVEPQPQTTAPEPSGFDFEPVVFPGMQHDTPVSPADIAPAPETKTQPVLRQENTRQWLTPAGEPDVPGPLDEVLPNSALKLPRLQAAPAEENRPANAKPAKGLSQHPDGDMAAVPFDTLKYTSPQTALPQPPAQAPPQAAKRGKTAGEVVSHIGRHAALAPVTVMSLSRRLYSFAAYQLSKLKYLPRKARVVLLAVCLTAAVGTGSVLLYGRLHYEIPDAAKPAYGGVNIRAADLRNIDEIPLEQQQTKAAAVKAKGDKDVFEFFALTDIIISEPADNLPIVLGNLKKNDCTFIVSLVDREGQLMARTLGLPPGKYLPYITLIDRKLPYGEYDHLKLVVSAYDSDTLAYLGSQYTDFRLVIGIEDEASTATPGQ